MCIGDSEAEPTDPVPGGATPRDHAAPPDDHDDPTAGLAIELTGGLPCVRCTYDLRGLSVRAVCPECGTAIRATILARVDPLARELQPVYTPRLTAGCLVLWAAGALGAAVASWVPRIVEGLARLGHAVSQPDWPRHAALAGVAVSGLASLALVRPHGRIPTRHSVCAATAALLYVPLWLVLAHIGRAFDARDPSPFLGVGGIDPARATWRLAADGLIIAIVLGLRPAARVLAARSLVMRTGRVDRQTMLAMAAAVGVCALGDALAIISGGMGAMGSSGALRDVLGVAAMLFIGVGSLLVTLGLGTVMRDVLRLVPVVAERPLSMADIAGPPRTVKNGR